jgi:glycosyltransferase involved in cell wall biosynthesis
VTVLFSVVVPTIGRPNLAELLKILNNQTFDRSRFEVLVVADGVALGDNLLDAATGCGARVETLQTRGGPGRARNFGANLACGSWLAFTEDDVRPEATWLEDAARAIGGGGFTVLEGETLLPNGSPARKRSQNQPSFIPTNLFVLKDTFFAAGQYSPSFFNPVSKNYFREDSDFGFSLQTQRAKVVVDSSIRVTHPFEHPSVLDPIYWAKRYEMDPVLKHRHRDLFRSQIEVSRIGWLTLHRPFVRVCQLHLLALASSLFFYFFVSKFLSFGAGAIGLITATVLWGKWSFDLRRLPILPIVPFVLVGSLIRGWVRVHATRVAL